jgi:siroheme synthase-like protein
VSVLPLMLDGSKLAALVVGGGAVASRKVRALLDGGALVTVVAPVIEEALARLATSESRLMLRHEGYDASHIGSAMIVIAATNDPDVNARVAADATRLGRLVNVVDRPDTGNFVTPAVHRAGDLVIAVGTGGVPGAAAAIRDEVAQRFDDRYAAAIADIHKLRDRLIASGQSEAWRAIASDVFGDFCAKVESRFAEQGKASWR